MAAVVIILFLLVVLVATDGDSRHFDPAETGSLIPAKTPARSTSWVYSHFHHSKTRAVAFSLFGVTLLVIAALLLSGCTKMQNVPVSVKSDRSVAVHVGDDVEIKTKTGQNLVFQVTQIEPAALAGKDVQANYEDIAGLQVKRMNKFRTVASATGVTLLLGLAYLLTHIGPGMAGP